MTKLRFTLGIFLFLISLIKSIPSSYQIYIKNMMILPTSSQNYSPPTVTIIVSIEQFQEYPN
jgi:hypothetical protein